MRFLASLALCVFAISSNAFAAAPQEADTRSARSIYLENPFAFGMQLAPLGSAQGVFGFTLDYALLPELSVTGGAGLGVAGKTPWQYGIALRPRIPIRRIIALDLTAGVSRGDYQELSLDSPVERYTNCTWLNVDFGPELRFESGVILHPFVGFSKLIASDEPTWSDGAPPGSYGIRNRWPLLPTIGINLSFFVQ